MTSFNIQIRTRDLCTACAARQPWKILLYSSRTHHAHRELFQVCLIRLGFSGPRQLRLAGAFVAPHFGPHFSERIASFLWFLVPLNSTHLKAGMKLVARKNEVILEGTGENALF